MFATDDPAHSVDEEDGNVDRNHVSLAPGEQALVLTESMARPLSYLPDVAFENLLVVSVGRQPKAIEKAVRARDRDPSHVGVVPITGSAFSYDGPMWTSQRVDPNDLTGISIEFGRGMQYVKRGQGWICLDNVSTLLMYAETSRVHRLLSALVKRAREQEARGAYALVRESVTDRTYAQMREPFDREIDCRSPQA